MLNKGEKKQHVNMNKEYMECTLPYAVTHLGIHVFLIFKIHI